jgi:hypothetical protein
MPFHFEFNDQTRLANTVLKKSTEKMANLGQEQDSEKLH